jgi:predicted nucleotidyltransferase
MSRREIERIALNIMAEHGCHTVILYGSWARGQATQDSDVDLLCIRESGPDFRDARIVERIYIDAFIYPEAALKSPDTSLLRVLGGVVLHERDGFGSGLLVQLQELNDRGPTRWSEDASIPSTGVCSFYLPP